MGAQLFNPSLSKQIKWKFGTGCLFSYVILFFGMYFLVTGFNLLYYLDRISRLMKYGIVLHFMLACGMAFWGAKLLLSAPNHDRGGPLLSSYHADRTCISEISTCLCNGCLKQSVSRDKPSSYNHSFNDHFICRWIGILHLISRQRHISDAGPTPFQSVKKPQHIVIFNGLETQWVVCWNSASPVPGGAECRFYRANKKWDIRRDIPFL